MSVSVTIVEGPLGPHSVGVGGAYEGAVGAEVVFDGIVRRREGEADIEALGYEAYRPMAENELARLAQLMIDTHGLIAVDVWHSVGRVPVDAVSFRLVIRSAHRNEALVAMGEFIDALKVDVPLWKKVGGD